MFSIDRMKQRIYSIYIFILFFFSGESPREDAEDHDIFISLTGTLYVVVNPRKGKDKTLKEHILKDIVTRGFPSTMNVWNGMHQQTIEEKDAAPALVTDDLQGYDNDIPAIQYGNVALQAQRDVNQAQLQKYQDTIIYLKTPYVSHARNPDKDNIIMIVQKHTTPANNKFPDFP